MVRTIRGLLGLVVACGLLPRHARAADPVVPLPGTDPLTIASDPASDMVDGIDRFLLKKLADVPQVRARRWARLSHPETDRAAVRAELKKRLAHVLGVRDARIPFEAPELVATTRTPARVGRSARVDSVVVRWPVFGDVWGEGLLLVPRDVPVRADVVALPDADQSPEQIAGLAPGVSPESQFARRLAELGCRVLVPTLVGRTREVRTAPGRTGGANLTDREFVHRSAFELGRHVAGYEVQTALAGVDWFVREAHGQDARIGIAGYGEGGLVALHAAALDERIDVCLASGFFGPREETWREPLDRNIFAYLEDFGCAELAALVGPRPLVVDFAAYPVLELSGGGGAPGRLARPAAEAVRAEIARALRLRTAEQTDPAGVVLVESSEPAPIVFLGTDALFEFLLRLTSRTDRMSLAKQVAETAVARNVEVGDLPDPGARRRRRLHELDRHNQRLLAESEAVRRAFFAKLDTSTPQRFAETIEPYREHFRRETIGWFDDAPLPPRPRTRRLLENDRWTAYEVLLDVWPEVVAYGVLLVPKGLREGERRPVVVCQHGLEGRPRDTIVGDNRSYHDYAAKLCEKGYVTFAPQNPYIFEDRFRTLQRKANPLGRTLFSVIVPQHRQIVRWLAAQPFADPDRIGFYGLSYGGKSAMRIPPLVPEYKLSICSADFNEWVAKNASTRLPFSYVWTREYEIFEFDLGSTFNYAEMAALIAPRPFMVERGHTDGVSTDEWVAYEFAKVRHLYSHRLKRPELCEMEVFDGPHTIHGKGTFEFLDRHLKGAGSKVRTGSAPQ